MPRMSRKSLETSFFHIIVQGIKREFIFKNNDYIEKYLELVLKYREKYYIKILSYCIMNNHAHLLIFTENVENMSNFMKSVNTSYGHYYNKNEQRVGFVFRDRYLSEPIYNKQYLLSCISYIHMNPVKAKIEVHPKDYKYSSYNQYINKNGIVTDEIIRMLFGSTKDYLEQFLILTEDEGFMDYEKAEYNTRETINKYCANRNIRLEEIINDEKEILDLVKYLITNKKLKQVDIAKELNINRLKLIRLLKKNEQK